MQFGDARLPERFWEKVTPEPNSGCWLWVAGEVGGTGYGKFWTAGKTERAHRVSFAAANGAVPDGLILDHLCRTRCCVNPEHLDATTHRENQHRSPLTSAGKTHCRRGHPYEGYNLSITRSGERVCKACRREDTRQFRRRQRGIET